VKAKTGKAFPELATKRLRLRRFEARDLAGLHACFGERLGFVCEGGPLRDRWRRGDAYLSVMMYALVAGGKA
jgi:hypothetical protein